MLAALASGHKGSRTDERCSESLADRVGTLLFGSDEVVREFSQAGNLVCERSIQCRDGRQCSGLVQMRVARRGFLGRERGDQLWHLHDIEDAPEIVGERGQAELAAHLLQPAHQKRALVHPLFDRAKRVFDGLAAFVEDVGALRYAGLHSVQYSLVLETRHAAEFTARALRPDRAVPAGLAVAVIDLFQAAQQRRRIGMETLTCWAQKAVAGWVVTELVLSEQARSARGTTLWARHVRVDPGLLAGL